MGLIGVLLVFIIFGIPSGIIMLIAEILINYSRDKETKAKLENLIPKRDTSHDTSFPDLQNTIGGKRQDIPEKEKKEYTYTYTTNGAPVSGSTKDKTSAKTWKVNKAEPYARPTKRSRKNQGAAIACFVISGLTFYTAASEIFEGIAEHGLEHITEFAGSVPMLLLSIACLIAGLWLVISKQRKIDKENRYIAIINQGYGMIPIDNISYLFPKKYDDCVKDLQELINKGVLPDAYIDYGRRLLVIDPNSTSVEPVIAPGKADAGDAVSIDTSKSSVKANSRQKKSEADHVDFMSLERLSKKVTDEDIKMKLIRISGTLKTIGQKAEEDPSIRTAAGVDTFMDMYLPKTIRLVEEYEEVNKAANLPEDNELKTNILDTLDAIDNASMTLWKDIIHSDMIDISAELDALQTKLVMDGYSESDFNKNAQADKIRHAAETQAYDMSDMDPEKDADARHENDAGERLDEDVFSKVRKEQEKTREKEPVLQAEREPVR